LAMAGSEAFLVYILSRDRDSCAHANLRSFFEQRPCLVVAQDDE